MVSRGFTLVEAIVVIGIIGLLAAIVIPNYRGGSDTLALQRAANKLAQDVRGALALSLQGEQFTGGTCTDFTGYGIHFDQNFPDCYLSYAECNGNAGYQGENCDGSSGGPDKVHRVFSFEKGVQIKSVNPSPKAHLLFTPPSPTIAIEPGAVTEAVVVLELESDSTQTKSIRVNTRGMTDID